MSTPLVHELADVWELQAETDKQLTRESRETLRMCADLLRMVLSHQGSVARVPIERSYDTRVRAIIAFNNARKSSGNLDDHLEAAWRASLSARPAPVRTPPAPDIPPGCEMARGWSVQVSVFGDALLTIEDGSLSSLQDLAPWESTIHGCIRHLAGFMGNPDKPASGNQAGYAVIPTDPNAT